MKIRSQINGLLVLAALIIPVAVGMTLLSARDVEQATSDINAAEDLIHSATQLRQVAVETALFDEVRAKDQWSRKIAGVSGEIDRMRTTTPREKTNLDQIRMRVALMEIIYPRLTVKPGAAADAAAAQTRAVASLLGVTQELIEIGNELIRSNRDEAGTALRAMQVSIGVIILAMGAFTVFVWLLIRRRILRPLRIFEQSTTQLAQGNYAYRLKLQQIDEIGDLARAFNAMIARIETSTVELEKRGDRLADAVLARTTELFQAKELAETLSHYARSLIEANLDPLVTISAHGTITDVNEASVQATGVPREQLIGTDFSDYFTEPDKARIGYKKVFSQGMLRDYPLAIRHRAGGIMDVLYHAAVYRDDKGNVLGVLAAARDITERKHLDQLLHEKNAELEHATAVAEKANLGKSEFLSSMSHELRTPLNAILGFAQLIESDSPPPTPTQKRGLDQILRAGWYLLELINEILDLAQIDSGKIMMSLEPVSLADVMSDCQTMVGPQANDRAITIMCEPLASAYFILADQTRTKQVLINLLSNAIKYNRPGGAVNVACALVAPDSIRISIQDTGFGMTAQQLAQLFQPFNRLGKESGPVEGTGIGLVVTKRLVELMGGAIGVDSAVGVGSVFWIEFKLTTTPQIDIQATEHKVLKRSQGPDGTPMRTLLYVEDNPANLQLIEQLLARHSDLRMLSAADGNLGIEFARAHQPDVILMDINLPGINGIDAMKILRADPLTAHIPIIAVSANALPRDIERCLALGFFDYLTKPIMLDELVRAIDLALPLSVSN
ncbi:MAG: response regulator [Rhodoferax sp.]|uniref:response regulator n=1 Tax=Rhodoferax sp. TaxID=50421 RepID=UPI0014013DCC|nr:response regulator [Rhodoferax sp.]NDP37866.1 response regulator [Rhodoferax sp.]